MCSGCMLSLIIVTHAAQEHSDADMQACDVPFLRPPTRDNRDHRYEEEDCEADTSDREVKRDDDGEAQD